jgi:dTDP-glucose pyrophosphorylase
MSEMIRDFVENRYPELNTRFVFQRIRDGDGSAIRLSLEGYEKDDELFIVFGDTMVDFEYKKVIQKKKGVDSLVLSMEVDNPQNFGIINAREDGDIYRIEEKPSEPKENLLFSLMKLFIEKENKTFELAMEREKSIKELLKEQGISLESVILIKNNEIVLEDEEVSNSDTLKLLSVVSGG